MYIICCFKALQYTLFVGARSSCERRTSCVANPSKRVNVVTFLTCICSRWFLLFRLMIPLDFNHLLPGGSVWQMEVFDFSLWHWWHLGNPSLDGIETWNFPKKVRVSCRFCPWPQWPVTIFRRRFCSSAFFAVATVAREAELSKLCPQVLLLFLSLDESWGDRFLRLHGLVLSHLCRRKHYTCWLVVWNIFYFSIYWE